MKLRSVVLGVGVALVASLGVVVGTPEPAHASWEMVDNPPGAAREFPTVICNTDSLENEICLWQPYLQWYVQLSGAGGVTPHMCVHPRNVTLNGDLIDYGMVPNQTIWGFGVLIEMYQDFIWEGSPDVNSNAYAVNSSPYKAGSPFIVNTNAAVAHPCTVNVDGRNISIMADLERMVSLKHGLNTQVTFTPVGVENATSAFMLMPRIGKTSGQGGSYWFRTKYQPIPPSYGHWLNNGAKEFLGFVTWGAPEDFDTEPYAPGPGDIPPMPFEPGGPPGGGAPIGDGYPSGGGSSGGGGSNAPEGFFEAVGDFFGDVGNWFADLGGGIADGFGGVMGWLEDLAAALAGWMFEIFGYLSDILSVLQDTLSEIVAFFGDFWDNMVTFFGDLWDTLAGFFGDVVDAIVGLPEAILDGIAFLFIPSSEALFNVDTAIAVAADNSVFGTFTDAVEVFSDAIADQPPGSSCMGLPVVFNVFGESMHLGNFLEACSGPMKTIADAVKIIISLGLIGLFLNSATRYVAATIGFVGYGALDTRPADAPSSPRQRVRFK